MQTKIYGASDDLIEIEALPDPHHLNFKRMKCTRYALECKRGCTDKCGCENSYCPSNGSEGECFTSTFCDNCIHQNPDPDKRPQCETLMLTMCYYPTDPEYPREWIYDTLGHPKCTKFVNWNWNDDGDPNDPDNPKKLPDPPDPRQLNLFPLFHPETQPQQIAVF